jgi:F-type H+-transporting ATPase subunit b
MRRLPALCLALLAALLLAAAPALAAEEPGAGAVGWAFRWLNFLVVFGGAGYLVWRYGRGWFRARTEEISSGIEHAVRVRQDAATLLRGAEEKLGNLDREAEEMRAAARRDAQSQAERIRAGAGEEAEKIARAGDAEIAATARAARLELKAVAARLATERAEALLRRQMSKESDAILFRFFVASLARGSAP